MKLPSSLEIESRRSCVSIASDFERSSMKRLLVIALQMKTMSRFMPSHVIRKLRDITCCSLELVVQSGLIRLAQGSHMLANVLREILSRMAYRGASKMKVWLHDVVELGHDRGNI